MTKSKSPEQRIAELEMMLQSQSALLANVRRTMSRWANDESFASLLQGGPQWIDGVNIQQNTVEADRINAENLQALAVDTGSLTVDGVITLGAGGSIIDADGSYWDQDGIVLKATGSLGDVIRMVRDTYDAEGFLRGLISSALGKMQIGSISPDGTNTLFLDITSVDIPADMGMTLWKDDGGAASALMSVNGDGDLYPRGDITADGEVFEQADDGVSSTLKGGLQTSTVLVYNTTTETTLYSATIPANYLKNAVSAAWERVLHFTGVGVVAFDNAATLTLRCKLGGSTVHTQTIGIASMLTNGLAALLVNIWIYPRSSSQVMLFWTTRIGGDAVPGGSYDFGDPTGSAINEDVMSGESLISLTNTSSQAFSLTAQISVASTTEWMELLNGHIVRH